jgi:chloride channel protein, CIC family
LVGLLYAKGFYGIEKLFVRLPTPRWVNPALGALLVGLTALALPEVLGTGYGWIQESLGPQLLGIPLWIVLVLPLARIVATGLSIGSGGSGGVFGPGMVVGAFLGASVWRLFEPVVPSMGHNPAPYVIVGMMCCFGGISRAPLAVMIMVAEMTGSLSIIGPAIVAVGLSWLIVRHFDDTMYRSQRPTRRNSPTARLLADLSLLAPIPVTEAMTPAQVVLGDHDRVGDALRTLRSFGIGGAPVVDKQGRFEGTVSVQALGQADGSREIRSLVDAGAPSVVSGAFLEVVMEALAAGHSSFVSVLDDDRRPQGTVSIADLVRFQSEETTVRARRSEP